MKPLKFVRLEIRKPRYDPHPEKSTTNNSDWRLGLFVIFEDYQGNQFDWMPKWDEVVELRGFREVAEQVNKEVCKNVKAKEKDNGQA